MNCPRCESPDVCIESKQNGDRQIKCQKCGFNEIRDKKGRKLLLSTVERGDVLLS